MGAIGRTLSAEESIRLDRYILDHPDMKISEIAAAMGVWRGTVARHRRNLAGRGRTSRDLPKTEREVRDLEFWKRKARKEGERAAAAEHVARELAGIVARPAAPPAWTISATSPEKKGRAAGLIHLSDLHVGEVVRADEIGGVNRYDPEVFRERLRRMIAASTTILRRWASDCSLEGVILALNGDIISGDIHDELRRFNALTAHEQVNLAIDELSAAIAQLAKEFPYVLVVVTGGNHGRTTEKNFAKRNAYLSYDILIGTQLQRQFAGEDRITIHVASGPDVVFPVFGWTVLQTHGDAIGTGGGMGFAGPNLPIVRGGNKIELAGAAIGEHYDIILLAHYHFSSNPGPILANGSMVGYSENAQRIRAKADAPRQWLGLIHERWGLRERLPVALEDPPRPHRPRIRLAAGRQRPS